MKHGLGAGTAELMLEAARLRDGGQGHLARIGNDAASARSYDAAPLAPLVTGQRAARRGRALSGTA